MNSLFLAAAYGWIALGHHPIPMLKKTLPCKSSNKVIKEGACLNDLSFNHCHGILFFFFWGGGREHFFMFECKKKKKLSHVIRIISIQVSARPVTYPAPRATPSKAAHKT